MTTKVLTSNEDFHVTGDYLTPNQKANSHLNRAVNEVGSHTGRSELTVTDYSHKHKEAGHMEIVDINDPRVSSKRRLHHRMSCYLAEFVGTLLLVLFGDGAVAQGILNPAAKGSSYLTINLGFGLGLMLGVYIAAPSSGAHLNPAITLANALFRKFPWSKVPGYFFSQLLGAFVASCLIMLCNYPAINEFDGGIRQTVGDFATAGIFATYPAAFVPTYFAFFIELVSTALLILGVLTITDPRHETPSWFAPIAIGGVITAIGMTTGWLTGFAINPARDLGPRLFTLAAGWGTNPFTAAEHYFWVPLIAPFVGAIFGIAIYDVIVPAPLGYEVQEMAAEVHT